MSDLIDRNDAIEAIKFEKVYMTAYRGSSNGYVSEGNPFKQYNKGLDDAIKAINSLTPVKPERKKGKWIDISWSEPDQNVCCTSYSIQSAKCSICGKYHTTPYLYSLDYFPYCPNCGADMRGEQ